MHKQIVKWKKIILKYNDGKSYHQGMRQISGGDGFKSGSL